MLHRLIARGYKVISGSTIGQSQHIDASHDENRIGITAYSARYINADYVLYLSAYGDGYLMDIKTRQVVMSLEFSNAFSFTSFGNLLDQLLDKMEGKVD
jgi:hypothetical protein